MFYARLYRAFWPTMNPQEVDEQEVFQLAILLGSDQVQDSDWEMSEADRQRMETWQTPAEPGTDITDMVMAQMGIKT